MRIALLCILAFAPLFAAEFGDDPEVIAVRRSLVAAELAANRAIVARFHALQLKPLAPVVLESDPKQSEVERAAASVAYNQELRHTLRFLEDFSTQESWRDKKGLDMFCQRVDQMLAIRAKAGEPAPTRMQKPEPKSPPINEAKLSDPAAGK